MRSRRQHRLGAVCVAAALVAATLWFADGNAGSATAGEPAPAPATTDEPATAAPAPHELARVPAAGVGRHESPREPDDAGPAVADTLVAWEQLPTELQKPLQKAFEGCAHACQALSLPVPDWRKARLALADARDVIAREAELQRRILDSALASERELSARLEADPHLGLRVPRAERARLPQQLQERYPGWPDGYVFVEESDGVEVRIAAVLVASDPVLRALAQDHDALTGEYARAVRAKYREVLRP